MRFKISRRLFLPGDVHRAVPIYVSRDELIALQLLARKGHFQDDPLHVVVAPGLVEDKVAQPVEHGNPVNFLVSLGNVGMVANNQVRARLYGYPGEPALEVARH